jgi:hypothetical protein
MAGTQRLLAIAMAFSLARIPGSAKPDALGIVVRADRARLDSQPASEGTTIFDGDRLTTEAGGSLRLLIGEAMLDLAEQSSVIVHHDANLPGKEFAAELMSGTAEISVTAGASGEIVASSARVRPLGETRGVARVGLLRPHELIVFARRGPAQICYHGECETVAEEKSYRVVLNPSDDDAAGDQSAKKPGRRGKAFVVVAVAATTAAGVAAVLTGSGRGSESPDRP